MAEPEPGTGLGAGRGPGSGPGPGTTLGAGHGPEPGPGAEPEPEPGDRSSPLAEALARVGDRWTLLVVEALLPGPRRFNDLLGLIPGIAANILSERLKRLERAALLVARPYSERPPRVAYELTAEGKELAGALRLLAHWGAQHADPAGAPRHHSCGTPVEVRWYCPTCDQLVEHEPHDGTELHYV